MQPAQTLEKSTPSSLQPERTRSGATFVPGVDIVELPDAFLLYADVPGATADQIDVQYERGQLTLTAAVTPRQAPSTRFLLREYSVGDYVRSFQIGEGIDPNLIEANIVNGVLTLRLPKTQAARIRKIEVKAAD